MSAMRRFCGVRRAGRGERGATAVEWALIVALTAAVLIVPVRAIGNSLAHAVREPCDKIVRTATGELECQIYAHR